MERKPCPRAVLGQVRMMPQYHFCIQDGDPIGDEDGAMLPDDQTARSYAMQIIHELQKGDERTWSGYTMEVICDGRVVWRIPFEVSYPSR